MTIKQPELTRNEAYLYAKRIRRLNLTKAQLEKRMMDEGYDHDSILKVRDWLSHGRVGV